jgi:transglutaminase-like putative cysteine protease
MNVFLKNGSKKVVNLLLCVLLFFLLLPRNIVHATDFENKVDFIYSVDPSGLMHIREVRSIRNNSSKYYIKATSEETFIISSFKTRAETTQEDLEQVSNSIKVTDQFGNKLSPNIEITENQIKVTVAYGSDINNGDEKVIILEYDNFELVEKAGNIWNVYIPGVSEEFNKTITSDIGATTQTSFTATLEIDNELGEPNFILPESYTKSESDGKTIYAFESASLINQSAWIQIGSEQYYSFKITQPISLKGDLASSVFNALYDLVLPGESASGNQVVYYSSISPEPEYIREDGEGNILARFSFSNDDTTEIVVEGYISTSITKTIKQEEVGDITDIPLEEIYAEIEGEIITYEDLIGSSQYWEVDATEVQDKATELKGNSTNVFDILLADYNFITENVDYDNLKTGINNERQGALKTLQGGSSVCMEYSDLLITLLRAQGIPARAAFGFGFDPKSEGETEEGHQWVEVYMPNVGWVAVDPTWGDTGRKNYIGGDVDHALWRVASIDVDTPSPITKYSILDDSKLDPPLFEINVTDSLDTENMITFEELLAKYPYTPKHQIVEKIDQLNDYGKVVFLGIPGLIVLVLVIVAFTSGLKVIRKIANRRVVNSEPGKG